MTAQTVRMADLQPGDTFAHADGFPVADDLASHGGVPIGAIPRPLVAFIPLTVAEVREFTHEGRRMVYVESSSGRGSSYPWPGLKTYITERSGAAV